MKRIKGYKTKMKVSIIIPAYNVENYIGRTLKSCVEQSYSDIEVVVVNDGSTDKTAEIIDKITDVRVVKLTQANQGVSVARNHGLEMATGNFCIFLDGDDWLETNAVKCLVETYEREKCFTISTYKDAFLKDDSAVKIIDNETLLGPEGRYCWHGYKESLKPYFCMNSSCYKLYDLDIIRKNRLFFDSTIQNGEDGLFVFQYLQYVNDIYYLPDQLWVILNRPDSASRKPFNPAQMSIFRALDRMEKMSREEDDKNYFEWRKSERAYYLGWKLIQSENRDQKIIDEVNQELKRGKITYIFGNTKLRWKAKYFFMLLWYAYHTHKSKGWEKKEQQ